MKHGIICALLLWFFATVPTSAGQGTEARGTPAHSARIPVIYCTDLFHPHDDPDDHFDLATIYAIPELDLKGIILDQGEKQLQKPGKIPVSQMNRLTGRNIPAVPGLAHKLKSPSDQALDQAGFQQGVQFILDTLKQSSVPVMIAAVGGVRDIVAAFNRDPALFRAKVGKLLVFIGEASEPKYREYNVELDPQAYIGLMRSGLPIYWVPCFDGGVWQNHGHASFWQARHADLLQGASPELIQYFIYALEQEKADPLPFLAQPPEPERQKRLLAGTRNLWCTAVFGVLADKTAAFDGTRYLMAPARDVSNQHSPRLEPLFGFSEVEVYITDDAVVHYGHREDAHRLQRFEIRQPAKYAEGMTALTAGLLGRISRLAGADWPGYRGPQRNGIASETGWSWQWGTNGPPVRWQASVGHGFSSFAAVAGRVYTLGNSNQTDTLFCFEAATGKVLWRHSYPCDPQPLSYEGGPSATPMVSGGRVYSFSKGGDLFCLEAESGQVIWAKKFAPWPQLPGDWQNTWRYAGSPLVQEGRLFLSVGQGGLALNALDGATLWESPAGHPGYASPVPFRAPTGEALAFFSGHAVVGVQARSGQHLWKIPWQTLWDLNAADPIIHDGKMFVSSGNGVGCALFDLESNPPRELWRNKNLKTTMNSAVLWQGLLFGFNDSSLSCLSWETGEERWTTRDLHRGSLIVADGKLLLLSETGKLVVAEGTDRAYHPLAQAQILPGRCWTTPVLSHGLLFARNATGDLVCLDLRQPAKDAR